MKAYKDENGNMMKQCPQCRKDGIGPKPISEFSKDKTSADGLRNICKEHISIYTELYNSGIIVSKTNKNCSQYLHNEITEKVLSKEFDNMEWETNNPKFDLTCGKNKKIKIVSACKSKQKQTRIYVEKKYEYIYNIWSIRINRNIVPDYFLVLLFNSRQDLEPVKLYLIPGNIINKHNIIIIYNSTKGLSKYSKYERTLDNVLCCCQKLKDDKN